MEQNEEGVWLGLLFRPTHPNSSEYIAVMMFHRNKGIVEAYLGGNQDIVDRFNLLVTGSTSPNNLKWAIDRLEEFLHQLPNGITVRFTVPNERLSKIYRYWLPKRFQLEYIAGNFILTNTHSKLHLGEQHDPVK